MYLALKYVQLSKIEMTWTGLKDSGNPNFITMGQGVLNHNIGKVYVLYSCRKFCYGKNCRRKYVYLFFCLSVKYNK